MKRFATVAVMAMMVASLPVVASAAPLSAGCSFLNVAGWDDSYTIGLAWDRDFNAGETVTMASSSATDGSPTALRLLVDLVEVAADGFPGEVSWTVPSTGTYSLEWESVGGTVQWEVSCSDVSPVVDGDADGVVDADDLCPGTTVDAIPSEDLRSSRYGWYGGSEFVAGSDDAPVFTIADTGGCSATQVIAQQGLGAGHLRFGVSLGELRKWIEALP